MPGADQLPPELLMLIVAVMVNTFDGAALIRAVLPQPELEDGRIQLLATMLGKLGVQT